jgi:hypothetical protein
MIGFAVEEIQPTFCVVHYKYVRGVFLNKT